MRQFVCFGVFFWAAASGVLASGDFQTRIVVTYKFDAQGQSMVEQQTTITNNTSEKYAREFQFTSVRSPTQNISGHNANGPLQIATASGQVRVIFNEPVVGKNQSQEFWLNYSGPKAIHNGQIWELTLPPAPNTDLVDDYEVRLVVDSSLGNLAVVTPQPKKIDHGTYIFTKEQLDRVGVAAAFGNFQTFGFNLNYQLANSQNRPVYLEIALPADTNYQRVFYENLQPRPINVRVDADGNWLARYDLKPAQALSVFASGQAHILVEPSRFLSEPESPIQLNKYLQPTYYWPALDIKFKTPEEIYNYVVTSLHYDFTPANHIRQGASNAVHSAIGVCTEFTDLFIALARSSGIPAREVNGFAYSTDNTNRPLSLAQDVLHAWPQYWDEGRQTWVSVDPTWGKTTGSLDFFHKLDFNHFAFVTHGLSDTTPLAAGFYKTGQNQKNVAVNFTAFKDYPQPELAVNWKTPWQIFPIQDSTSYLVLTNSSGQALYKVNLQLVPENFQLVTPPEITIAVIPPFSHVEVPVVIGKGQYLNFWPQVLTLRFRSGPAVTYNIPASLYLFWHFCVGLFFSAFLVGLAYVTGRARSVYFQRPKSEPPLRRKGQ
jgi:hypothetical protein